MEEKSVVRNIDSICEITPRAPTAILAITESYVSS